MKDKKSKNYKFIEMASERMKLNNFCFGFVIKIFINEDENKTKEKR